MNKYKEDFDMVTRLCALDCRERTILNYGIEEGRTKAIDEFAERLKDRIVGMQMAELQGEDVCPCHETGEECKYMNQDIACQYCAREQTKKDINEIAEEMRGTT